MASQALSRAAAALCAFSISASLTDFIGAPEPGGLVWPVAVTARPPFEPAAGAGSAEVWAPACPAASVSPRINAVSRIRMSKFPLSVSAPAGFILSAARLTRRIMAGCAHPREAAEFW